MTRNALVFVFAFRFVCTIVANGCSSDGESRADMTMPLDFALPPDLSCVNSIRAACNPDCPKNVLSCYGGLGSSCGSCTHVGETCFYGEPIVRCACDHQWHCAPEDTEDHCGTPDGGYVCN